MSTPAPTGSSLRQRLRTALTAAMKDRDRAAVAALRATLAAIDNAEAVDQPAPAQRGLAIEESPVGAGAAEVARRALTEAHVAGIVAAEITEREAAALQYARMGQHERAGSLRAEAQLLADLVAEPDPETASDPAG